MAKIAVKQKRIEQRLKDAFEFGMRARNFTPPELLQQADELISFAMKLNRSTQRR